MRLNNKDTRTFLSFIIILFFLATGSTKLNEYLPPQLKKIIYLPSPTTNPQIQGTSSDKSNLQKEVVKVIRIIDGDTIQLEDGRKLRYIGIDTPELTDPRKGMECYGKESSKRNHELVFGKNIRIEKDVSETDRYKRILRYVYIDEIMINELLVKEGYALASSYPPDVKYQDILMKAQEVAKANKSGLWGNCITTF